MPAITSTTELLARVCALHHIGADIPASDPEALAVALFDRDAAAFDLLDRDVAALLDTGDDTLLHEALDVLKGWANNSDAAPSIEHWAATGDLCTTIDEAVDDATGRLIVAGEHASDDTELVVRLLPVMVGCAADVALPVILPDAALEELGDLYHPSEAPGSFTCLLICTHSPIFL